MAKAIGITWGVMTNHPQYFFYIRIGFVLDAEFKKHKYKYLG
jgi:hypothetical protein